MTDFLRRIQFNTGRQYTERGQRIVAAALPDRVLFNDVSRGIDGTIPLAPGKRFDSGVELREFTMANYDMGNYGWDMRARDLKWEE